MKNTTPILALLASMLMFSSCDFFRIIAGRPTSADIEAKRALIAQEKARHQRHVDSLQVDQTSDSLAALEAAATAKAESEKPAVQPKPQPQAQTQTKPEPAAKQAAPKAEPVRKEPVKPVVAPEGVKVFTKRVTADTKAKLDKRFYVIIGSFGNADNASKLAAKAQAAGYSTYSIVFVNGFTSVGVGASDDIDVTAASLRKVQKEPFCPADAWILDNGYN